MSMRKRCVYAVCLYLGTRNLHCHSATSDALPHVPTKTQALKWYDLRNPHTKAYDRYLMKQLIGNTVANVSLKEHLGYDAALGADDNFKAIAQNLAHLPLRYLGRLSECHCRFHGDSSRYQDPNRH